MSTVLDTSAVLAWLREEDGAAAVDPLLATAVMATPNWSELAQKLLQHGVDASRTLARLRVLGITVEPFTDTDAQLAAELWPHTRSAGLSLGDRACLAVARRLELPAATADRAWRSVDGLPLDGDTLRIELIRD
ncbi:PIN domain-containing protein [Actinopolyspora mortivallis]|uniref:PIN domain nuclease n=1 Tax=Actinopolyspora mortivallis TaxID=33906 RepID=A0A2T0GXE5_ACTMO|nr:type II toxin-antitoxin system VapC family toxin [Actinopolyspora mortivallis]PRW63774.1 PIN domain nuclease [Actinopolyspora mortivallis]